MALCKVLAEAEEQLLGCLVLERSPEAKATASAAAPSLGPGNPQQASEELEGNNKQLLSTRHTATRVLAPGNGSCLRCCHERPDQLVLFGEGKKWGVSRAPPWGQTGRQEETESG